MIEIKDLNPYVKDRWGLYGGLSGAKYGILMDGSRWMVKFPENTKNFPGKEKPGHHIPSYTSSPVSEYIGSKIYESLEIPVHEVILGYRDGKIVAACKDFDPYHAMADYGKIKNAVTENDANLTGSSSRHGEVLDDVLTVIDTSDILRDTPNVRERFWDMFVTDAFIRNNDRNNGNWGVFINGDGTAALAPVYDNGNALFNKRNPSVAEKRLCNAADIIQDAIETGTSFFMDINGRHIHPFSFIENMKNEDCNAAVLRFAGKIDLDKVRKIVDDIPCAAYGIEIITDAQKAHYKRMFEIICEKSIFPTAEKIQNINCRCRS